MEAARVAALRGHQVMLYEKEHRLGGQLNMAAILRDEYESLARYLSGQLRKLGVQVVLGKEVGQCIIKSIAPDSVIVATGSVPSIPDIPGINGGNVIVPGGFYFEGSPGQSSLATLVGLRRMIIRFGFALLKRSVGAWLVKLMLGILVPFGKKVVIMGGGLPGVELANFLVQRGKEVTILETGEAMVEATTPMYYLANHLSRKLAAKGVTMLTGVQYERITGRGIVITTGDGERSILDADTVIVATGQQASSGIAQGLQRNVPEVHLVGDCVTPCGIMEAIHAGSRIGRAI